MSLRHLLVALILAATAAFVVGVVLEHRRETREPAAVKAAERHSQSTEGGASGDQDGGEHPPSESTKTTEHGVTGEPHAQSAELRPFGIDVEATPFVALAAAVSLLLALAAWTRPRPLLLVVLAGAMLAFALLDVREVFHQADEHRTGLALLAAAVAVLHAASAALAALLARRGEPAARAATRA